jgi:hypothetical protein
MVRFQRRKTAASLSTSSRFSEEASVLRNLARHLEKDWEGVFASILEGLDEMLTVTQLGLPPELRRSLTCANINGAARQPERKILALAFELCVGQVLPFPPCCHQLPRIAR